MRTTVFYVVAKKKILQNTFSKQSQNENSWIKYNLEFHQMLHIFLKTIQNFNVLLNIPYSYKNAHIIIFLYIMYYIILL